VGNDDILIALLRAPSLVLKGTSLLPFGLPVCGLKNLGNRLANRIGKLTARSEWVAYPFFRQQCEHSTRNSPVESCGGAWEYVGNCLSSRLGIIDRDLK